MKRRSTTNRNLRVALAVAVMLFGFGQAAHAVLDAVGPINPATGFPTSFTADIVELAPCDRIDFDPILGVNNPPCPGLELVDFDGGFVQGNIEEFTYYRVESELDGPNGERFLLRMEVQGGVLPPEIVSNAIRIRLRSLTLTGDYTVTTPLPPPNDSFVINAPDLADIDEAPVGFDGVAATTPPFSGTFPGPIGPYPSNGTGFTDPVTGEIFYGDGITAAPLEAPFLGGTFTVTMPDGTLLSTNLFVVEAKVLNFVAGTVNVTGANFSRTAAGAGQVGIFATGPTIGVLSVSGTGIPTTPLTGDAFGNFFASISVPAPFTPPPVITVTDSSSTPPGQAQAQLKDIVTITSATYNTTTQTLNISATSSDQGSPLPTLSTSSFGALTGGSIIVPGLAVPPAQVTVSSSAGGADTAPVILVSAPPVPPDTVTITRANFASRRGNWNIAGRAGPNAVVTVRHGATVIGTPTANARGAWRLLVRGFTGTAPVQGDSIVADSSLNGSATRAIIVR